MKPLTKTQFGNPILRNKAKKVNLGDIKHKSFQNLIKKMYFTMSESKGVGLAAPQVNKSIQLAIIEIKKNKVRPKVSPLEPHTILNPIIVKHSKKIVYDWEGCLSLSGVRGLVPRFSEVTVKYFDELGKLQTKDFKGFQARVFQHEIDHLNGILYVDRMKDMKTLMTLEEFKKRILGNKGLQSK